MTIEILYPEPAQRWIRADRLMSPNVQTVSMQTDPTENQNSIGVNCSIGKISKT